MTVTPEVRDLTLQATPRMRCQADNARADG